MTVPYANGWTCAGCGMWVSGYLTGGHICTGPQIPASPPRNDEEFRRMVKAVVLECLDERAVAQSRESPQPAQRGTNAAHDEIDSSSKPAGASRPRCGTYHYSSGWMCQRDEGHVGPCIANAGPNGSEWRVDGKPAVYAWHQPPGQPACNQRACDSNCKCAVSLNDQDGRE